MRRLLRDIFNDPETASSLAFKGGTAAMFFYGLPRFSVDLDFDLTDKANGLIVSDKIKGYAQRYGEIKDDALKRYGSIVVINYATGERDLKIEVSNRLFDNHYKEFSMGSATIRVLIPEDMLTHKLCAVRQRENGRDIFDVWYFLSKGIGINPNIIKERFNEPVPDFLKTCREKAASVTAKTLMQAVGEYMNEDLKEYARTNLIRDCCDMLEDYAINPVIANSEPTEHTTLLLTSPKLLSVLLKNNIEPSMISTATLTKLLSGKQTKLTNKFGEGLNFNVSEREIKVTEVRVGSEEEIVS